MLPPFPFRLSSGGERAFDLFIYGRNQRCLFLEELPAYVPNAPSGKWMTLPSRVITLPLA